LEPDKQEISAQPISPLGYFVVAHYSPGQAVGIEKVAKPTMEAGHQSTTMMGLAGLMMRRRIATMRPTPPTSRNERTRLDDEIFICNEYA
jgi:hypothetical protein